MIIRISPNGGSFRGAGAYYLHDKADDAGIDKALKPQSAERVWFTETRNCMNNDPFRALDEMWGVAEDQAYLKMQAGVKRGGRVCEDAVKTMSLSWHRDDGPTPEHMVEAADAFLKHMKWDEHQAVLVGHNDTDHRHIHIILNRVNPDNGRTLDDFREQKRAQAWALEYEREHGQVRCEQREVNAQQEAERANDNQREAAPEHQTEQTNQQQADASNQQQAEVAQQQLAEQSKTAEVAAERTPEPIREAQVEPVRDAAVEQTRAPDEQLAQTTQRAANDHLPHNVIMLTRPSEREFDAYEQLRADHDAAAQAEQQARDRVELKAEQRAEREAFFKDGSKLFKATRHAVYDEVRQEYKAEWREFYKDSAAAREQAEAASESGLSRAFHFAKEGQWEQAREAFDDRDSVRDAVEKELAERKADLKQRQNDDLRERQRDACDALREVRDVQYQELLQRQRDERAAFNANEALDALGIGRERADEGNTKPLPEKAANENRSAEATSAQQQEAGAQTGPSPDEAPAPKTKPAVELSQDQYGAAVAQALAQDQAAKHDAGGHIDLSQAQLPAHEGETRAPAHGVSDLAAGGIGSLANYLADQLGEMFAPTPPEVREANAKAQAKAEANREAERPTRDQSGRDEKAAAYDAIIEAAVRATEEERARQGEAWWKERDKGKGFERDQ